MKLILFTNDCHSGKCPRNISVKYQFSFCGVITLVNHFFSWWQIRHLLPCVSPGRKLQNKVTWNFRIIQQMQPNADCHLYWIRFTLLDLFSSPFRKRMKLYFELYAERKDHFLSKKVVLEVDLYILFIMKIDIILRNNFKKSEHLSWDNGKLHICYN